MDWVDLSKIPFLFFLSLYQQQRVMTTLRCLTQWGFKVNHSFIFTLQVVVRWDPIHGCLKCLSRVHPRQSSLDHSTHLMHVFRQKDRKGTCNLHIWLDLKLDVNKWMPKNLIGLKRCCKKEEKWQTMWKIEKSYRKPGFKMIVAKGGSYWNSGVLFVK